MNRAEILDRARALTIGERNATYGSPVVNMLAFSELLDGYFKARGYSPGSNSATLTAEDAAWIMVLAKMARCHSAGLPYHPDNYIDAAAYAAMAGECAAEEREG